ncbi:UNVERIFIED_CONTAM: hypothetical protein HDU68_003426, partial [Siphonaria sp. JEL0065]
IQNLTYQNLTINAGVTLAMAGFRLTVRGTLYLQPGSFITANGRSASPSYTAIATPSNFIGGGQIGSQPATGAAGTATTLAGVNTAAISTLTLGGRGGTGGFCTAAAAGTTAATNTGLAIDGTTMAVGNLPGAYVDGRGTGGSSGGQIGEASNNVSGGAGSSGGGVLVIAAQYIAHLKAMELTFKSYKNSMSITLDKQVFHAGGFAILSRHNPLAFPENTMLKRGFFKSLDISNMKTCASDTSSASFLTFNASSVALSTPNNSNNNKNMVMRTMIKPAPSRFILQKFGGQLTIDQFRESFTTNVLISMCTAPMIPWGMYCGINSSRQMFNNNDIKKNGREIRKATLADETAAGFHLSEVFPGFCRWYQEHQGRKFGGGASVGSLTSGAITGSSTLNVLGATTLASGLTTTSLLASGTASVGSLTSDRDC